MSSPCHVEIILAAKEAPVVKEAKADNLTGKQQAQKSRRNIRSGSKSA